MRFAYLILAHRQFEQIERLVGRLLRDEADDIVVLHVDARSAISDDQLAALRAAHRPGQIVITPRVSVRWGHPSMCEAVLLLIEALDGKDYEHGHLISGQDWPLLSKAQIEAAIEPGRCYLTLHDDPMVWRMDGFHFHNRLVSPHEQHSIVSRLWRRMLIAAGGIAGWAARLAGKGRRCPQGPGWQKGETWWSLPRAAIDYVRPLLAATIASGRLRHSLNSDEHVVQTILACSPFAASIEPNRRFMRWRGSSPELLERGHLAAMRASTGWFARKCDIAHDPFFLEL